MRTSSIRKVRETLQVIFTPDLQMGRSQGGRADPEEKPQAWRYNGHEGPYPQLHGQTRGSIPTSEVGSPERYEVTRMLARLWSPLSVRQELRGGYQGVQVCSEAGSRVTANSKRFGSPSDTNAG